MPQILYYCHKCEKNKSKIIRSGQEIPKMIPCECGSEMARTIGAPASTTKMVMDNGQSRAVEIHPDIMELRKDWSKPRND